MKIIGEVKGFSEFIASIINEAIRQALPNDNKIENLTDEAVCDILLLQEPEKYDNYLKKLAGNRKFSNEDIKDIIKNIANPKGELLSDEDELLNALILGKPSIRGEYPNEKLKDNKKLMEVIRENIIKKLEDALERDFPVEHIFYLDEVHNVRYIVGFYFLHYLRNRIANRFVLKKGEKSLLVDRVEDQEKLRELLEHSNLVVITGEPSSGKTSFIKSYAIKDDRDYLMIDGVEASDFDAIITSIRFEDDELSANGQIWKEIFPKYIPSAREENAAVTRERILKMPSKFGLIIDNFNGNAKLLDKLSEFSKCDNDQEKIRVIVITESAYESAYPSLKIEHLNEDQLIRVFENYSGVGDVNKDDELTVIVEKLKVQFKGWPELMVLAAEAYKNHLKKDNTEKISRNLLKNCLRDRDIQKTFVKDKEFHSTINPEQLKLRGHISKVQEKRAGGIRKEAFFLLSCLDGEPDFDMIPVPEYYFKKLCGFSDEDITNLSINHWIYAAEGNIYVRFPAILVSSAIKNDSEREQALEVVSDFLTRLGQELQHVEKETMSTEWILPIIGKALDLEKNWSNDSFERIRSEKFNNKIQDFYLCCVSYYIQNLDFKAAKKVLDYKKAENWSDNLAIRIWKAIIGINDESVEWDEILNRCGTMLMPLREEVNKLSLIEPESGKAYLILYEYLMDAFFLNFVSKETDDILRKQDDAPGNICNDIDSLSHYRVILDSKFWNTLAEYEKIWEECNKGTMIPYNGKEYYYSFYDKRMCFIRAYSCYRTAVSCAVSDDKDMNALFVQMFHLVHDLQQIWGEVDRKKKQRRDKIRAFNYYCDMICIQIMYSSLFDTINKDILYSLGIEGCVWWKNIFGRMHVAEQIYSEYEGFLPEFSKLRNALIAKYATVYVESRQREADKK